MKKQNKHCKKNLYLCLAKFRQEGGGHGRGLEAKIDSTLVSDLKTGSQFKVTFISNKPQHRDTKTTRKYKQHQTTLFLIKQTVARVDSNQIDGIFEIQSDVIKPIHQEVVFLIAVNRYEARSLGNTVVFSKLPSVPGVGVEHVALQSPITWLVADLWR